MKRFHLGRVSTVFAVISLVALAIAGTAIAIPPAQWSFSESGSDAHFFQCEGFDVQLDTTATHDFTAFADSEGNLIRLVERLRATDVLTNPLNGKTLVNRGVAQITYSRIGDSEDFLVTTVGHVFLVNEPGDGVVIQDVGRYIHTADSEEQLVFSAGKRLDFETAVATECASLA
jgi:hypothetical protein